MKAAAFIVGAALAASASAVDRIGDWWVVFPREVFSGLSSAERACATQAQKALDSGSAKAAAGEWKRFSTDFLATASEEALAWAAFMEAYSLSRANEAYTAVERCSEAMELYAGSAAACACQFLRGQVRAANGERDKALADYREALAEKSFAGHPLALVAQDRLAWAEAAAGRVEAAAEGWRAVVSRPRAQAPLTWDGARWNLSLLEAFADPDATVEAVAARAKGEAAKRRDALLGWRSGVWNEVVRDGPVAKMYFGSKAKDKARAEEMKYLRRLAVSFSKRAAPVFREADSTWTLELLDLEAILLLQGGSTDRMVAKLAERIRALSDAAERDGRAADLVRRLVDANRAAEARPLLELISDPSRRARSGASIGWRLRDGDFVVKHLAVLEGDPDPAVAGAAKREHARCCRELLRDYDGAIRLYGEASAPPGTLWAVAECHRLAGRKEKAYAVLSEIFAMFPDEAAAAMLRKGDWLSQDGDRKGAAACYRRILSHADWKRSSAASAAHQRLEGMGLDTGGGVLNAAH